MTGRITDAAQAETIPTARIRQLTSQPARSTPQDSDTAPPVRSLHLNESPFPPAPAVVDAMVAAATGLNRYPDHDGTLLVGDLAARFGVPANRIVIGAGSNELLYASADIALDPGDEGIAPSPGFPTYAKTITMRGATYVPVPTRDDGVVDVDATLKAITPGTRLVFVASPQNPTGGLMTAAEIETLVAGVPDHALLHFDEAYYEFGRHAGGPDALPILAQRTGPWISTRSFSKAFGLAGVRVGYGITGTPALAEAYRKIRINFSVNAVALAGARAALDQPEHLTQLLDHTRAERTRLAAGLAPLGFTALPSAANFITVAGPRPAPALAAALSAANIFVVPIPWRENGALRISIGSRADTDAVIATLRQVLG
jgi:histidinol-phosphate aminotransferase